MPIPAKAQELANHMRDTAILINRVQNRFFQDFGRYGQAKRSHVAIPPEGAESPITRADSTPSDQPYSLRTMFQRAQENLPTTLPYAVHIDVYESEVGRGYSITFFVSYSGNIWAKRIFPLDRSKDTEWAEVEQDGIN